MSPQKQKERKKNLAIIPSLLCAFSSGLAKTI